MSHFRKAMVLGLAVGLFGSVASLTSPGWSLEQQVGLGWLFKLRGKVPAPAEVVVVVLDKESARRFEQSAKIRNWARSLHAELIDRLTQRGAAVNGQPVTELCRRVIPTPLGPATGHNEKCQVFLDYDVHPIKTQHAKMNV